MKFFVLALATFSALSFAEDENRIYREGFDVLRNPSQAVNNVLCKSDDPNAPWCNDLYKHTCAYPKKSNLVGALDQSIYDRFTGKLRPDSTQVQKNDSYYAAIASTEAEVFGQSLAKRPDIVQVFMDAKTYMRQSITSNPYIPKDKQTKMANNIMSINMRTGREYIDEMIVSLRAKLPSADKEDIRKSAIELYQSSCGQHGLDVNAFYEGGKFVLCPGLVHSLSDYGPKNKSEVLNALSFTIGHEMGHSIDAAEFPEVYSNMRACYVGMTNRPDIWDEDNACEITGDYWGTLVMANRLRAQGVKGPEAARVAAFATDGWCAQEMGSAVLHSGDFRVNKTMSTFPALREAMSCEGPTRESPACMISGKTPR